MNDHWFTAKGPMLIKAMKAEHINNALEMMIRKKQQGFKVYTSLYNEYLYRQALEPWFNTRIVCPWCEGLMRRRRIENLVDVYQYRCDECQSTGPFHGPEILRAR